MIQGWAHYEVLLSFVHHRIFIDQPLLKEIPVFCSSLVRTELYWHKMVAVLCATGNNSVVAKHSSARLQNDSIYCRTSTKTYPFLWLVISQYISTLLCLPRVCLVFVPWKFLLFIYSHYFLPVPHDLYLTCEGQDILFHSISHHPASSA